MQCEEKDIPAFGLMGMLMHKMMNRAKGMYQEFDLNKSQAGILFTLHRSDSMSQKELAARLNVTHRRLSLLPYRRWRETDI